MFHIEGENLLEKMQVNTDIVNQTQFILQNAVGLNSRAKLTINVYLSPRNAMVSMTVLTVQMKRDVNLVSKEDITCFICSQQWRQ